MTSWSVAKTDALLSLIDGTRSARDIAAEMNRMGYPVTRMAVLGKTHRLNITIEWPYKQALKLPPRPPVMTDKHKMRSCLCCGTDFLSEGPGNRMCSPCRSRNFGLAARDTHRFTQRSGGVSE